MGIGNALQIGRSGLQAQRTAIEVTGQNLANVATEGYRRQSTQLAPVGDQEIQHGIFVGRGVKVQEIVRHIDGALEGRVRNGVSDQAASLARQDLLAQIEALQNELTDSDLSSQLNDFFNAWSNLANTPEDLAARTAVTQQGQTLGIVLRDLHGDLTEARFQLDETIHDAATTVNDLLSRLEQVNLQVAKTQTGSRGGHSVRDERDNLLSELSQYLDISIAEHSNGTVDVFVGSLPIILNNRSRGVEIQPVTYQGQESQLKLVIAEDRSVLDVTSGRLGALLNGREADFNDAIDTLDQLAHQLIHEVNRLHSQGAGLRGVTSVTAATRVADSTLVLTDPATELGFTPGHGSFQLHVTSTVTEQRNSSTVRIDLDGIDPANDTTLESLAAQIDGIANVSASITADGRLQLASASSDLTISFSDDTSGVLAALGINTFFTGDDAANIAVNDVVSQNPDLVAAAGSPQGSDNATARAIDQLRNQAMADLHGATISEFWGRHVEDMAIRLAQAQQQHQADTVVLESLETQRQSISGVNADEEAINLLTFQRAFQGSARFLTVVDEMLQTLLALI